MCSISGPVFASVVMNRTSHSVAVSTCPCHRYVLVTGPDTFPQAASRASTAVREIRSATSGESVVVVTVTVLMPTTLWSGRAQVTVGEQHGRPRTEQAGDHQGDDDRDRV